MLTFKTQFPIDNNKDIDDIIEVGRVWLANSPHSSLSESMKKAKGIGDEWTASSDNESVIFHRFDDDVCLAAFRHENLDSGGVRWVTEVSSHKDSESFWVSVQLSADSELPVERVDPGKRPYVLKNIMELVGGGIDGALTVSDTPYYLSESEIDLASDIIVGKAGCLMPTVFVSADNSNAPHVDPSQIARWLSGMAHVVVEPSRAFSFRLMSEVFNENAYGGAVAIYWPDGIGKWLFLPKDEFLDPKAMQTAISRKVRSSLLSQRTKSECRWGFVQELSSKKKLYALKESGSEKVEDYVALFDKELAAKDEEIQRLECEVSRLKYGGYSSSNDEGQVKNRIFLDGAERDLYQAERISIIIDALNRAKEASEDHSRRFDVISDLIEKNNQEGERDTLLERLKALLRDYTSMSSTNRSEFESMGFDISEEGKHYKLVFRNDHRYSFILSKTGSDNRGGLNAFSDLKRRIF